VHISYEEAYGEDFEDIQFRVPDTKKTRETIGIAATLNLDQILDRIVDFHKTKKH
jgi:UDP-glucose 4-epimerase